MSLFHRLDISFPFFFFFLQFLLEIINKSENTKEGIMRIIKMQHQLVPGYLSDSLVRFFLVGD